MRKELVIIGLGNPGEKYQGTRHNVGFEVLELLATELSFPPFIKKEKLKAEVSELVTEESKILLVKPTTFMNRSGESARLFHFPIVVVHDDIDIPLGSIKFSENRGAGGHNGVASIIKELGNREFSRVRVGILPQRKPQELDSFVLKRPPKEERTLLDIGIELAKEKLRELIEKPGS